MRYGVDCRLNRPGKPRPRLDCTYAANSNNTPEQHYNSEYRSDATDTNGGRSETNPYLASNRNLCAMSSPYFPDPSDVVNKYMYKQLRERVLQLRMQFTEPLAAILLEQLEEPPEKW